MGCGRVGAAITVALGEGGAIRSRSSTGGRRPSRSSRRASTRGPSSGQGFDRTVLEEAGIREAEGFVAVSSGDNSNIVSARIAREHYHVPKVIARIYDPRRADIYERLNIPTIASVRWAAAQIQFLLFHGNEAEATDRPLLLRQESNSYHPAPQTRQVANCGLSRCGCHRRDVSRTRSGEHDGHSHDEGRHIVHASRCTAWTKESSYSASIGQSKTTGLGEQRQPTPLIQRHAFARHQELRKSHAGRGRGSRASFLIG